MTEVAGVEVVGSKMDVLKLLLNLNEMFLSMVTVILRSSSLRISIVSPYLQVVVPVLVVGIEAVLFSPRNVVNSAIFM